MKRILIIPTAGLATRLCPVSDYYPKALIPLGDEPVLAKILRLYKQVTFEKVILVIAPNTENRFQTIIQSFLYQFQIQLVIQPTPEGLVHALCQTTSYLEHVDQVCVHLADTILTKPFQEKEFKQSFVCSGDVADSAPWCMVKADHEKKLILLEDKPQSSYLTQAIIGVYFFNDARAFLAALTKNKAEQNLSKVICDYIQSEPVYVHWRKDWYDTGSLKRFHQIPLSFETAKDIEVVRKDNQIIKKSRNKNFLAEEYFYRHTPNLGLFPQFIQSSGRKLKLTYQPLRSLAYYALFENIPLEQVIHIINSLWQLWHSSFYHTKSHWSQAREQTEWMYGQRVLEVVENKMPEWADISFWTINNKQIKGFVQLRELILKRAEELASDQQVRAIHGDLHLGNILYDPLSHTFVLVDPRGMWGKQFSIFGDVRYDFAKFLHSFHGGYEFIKRGLSSIQTIGHNSYTFAMPTDPWRILEQLKPIVASFNLSLADILWIEGLCFLSMCRCYSDLHLRQQFFLRGLHLLNQLI